MEFTSIIFQLLNLTLNHCDILPNHVDFIVISLESLLILSFQLFQLILLNFQLRLFLHYSSGTIDNPNSIFKDRHRLRKYLTKSENSCLSFSIRFCLPPHLIDNSGTKLTMQIYRCLFVQYLQQFRPSQKSLFTTTVVLEHHEYPFVCAFLWLHR